MKFEGQNINGEQKEETSTRRSFLKKTLGAGVALALGGVATKSLLEEEEKKPKRKNDLARVKKPLLKNEDDDLENTEQEETDESREYVDWKKFKKLKPNIKYREVVPKLKVEHLRMPDDIGRYGAETFKGKILRSLKYKNITDAVEDRYNLPPGIILSMIMKESTGVDLLPNALGDGGFGLCHMQGSTAREFGLHTFHDCNAMVCNGEDKRSCKGPDNELKNHAKELASFMKKNANDREALVKADERLNILLNLDAVGRMIASHMAGPKLKGELTDLGPFRRAIAKYAGKDNYKKGYWEDICKNMRALRDQGLIDEIANMFDRRNTDLKINGEKAGFYEYVTKFREQNENYGLEEYKTLPKYVPKNSTAVLKTYKKYI